MARLRDTDHSLNVPEAIARLDYWLEGLTLNAPVRLLMDALKKEFPQPEADDASTT